MKQSSLYHALLDPKMPTPTGLHDGSGKSAEKRFAVYRNNVTMALLNALRSAFPILKKLLGTQQFDRLALDHLRTSPPKSPVMMYYGAEFPQFIAEHELSARFGYLPDIARLELAMRQSYHAADSRPLAPEALAELTPDDLMQCALNFSPATLFLDSKWPIFDIWRYNTEPDAPKPQPQAQPVLIMRAQFDPVPFKLSAAQAAWVQAMLRGDTLGKAMDAAFDIDSSFELNSLMASMIAHSAITNIRA